MKAGLPKLHECPRVLIVEGYSDLLFCAAFLHHLGCSEGVFIKEFKGVSRIKDRELLGDFITPKLLAEKAGIGILIDADDNPSGAVQSLHDHLLAITGREVKESEWSVKEGEAKLGFFVAPDPATKGEIETLAWNGLPQDHRHTSMKKAVGDYLEDMEHLGWKAHSPDKARIGTYLAAAYDEDPRLGPGAREGKFDFTQPGFGRLRAFLEGLTS